MSDFPNESWGETVDRIEREKNPVGRPATGQNTKVIRVPLDFNRQLAIKMYYDWYPIIQEYADYAAINKKSVRWEKLIKLLEELGEL
jgi:hypothetical protein